MSDPAPLAQAADGPRATLPGTARLRTQRQFRRVYQRGKRATGQWFTVVVCPVQPGGGQRIGLSVSKEHGGAVRRNKLKRLLREAFRLERHTLPTDLDLVLIPRVRPENFPLAELRSELGDLIARANRQGGDRRPRRKP